MKKAKLEENTQFSIKAYQNVAAYWIDLFQEDLTVNKTFKCPSQIQIKDTKLEKEIFQYFSRVVPSLLKQNDAGGVLRFVTDEDEFERLICKPLEYFICKNNNALNTLKEFSNPSKFCGEVFQLGDPTYTCKLVFLNI